MKARLLLKVLLCLVPSILLAGVAYWLYTGPARELQAQRETILSRASSFLNEFLWNEYVGAYRECPAFTKASCALNYSTHDNYLAYIFNTEYVVNQTKSAKIHAFLVNRNLLYYNRWVVLSHNYTQYPCSTCNETTPYNDDLYSDHVALDGIYDWKTGNTAGARERFSFLVSDMLDPRLGLFIDNATSSEGFVYYKISLALILSLELNNSTYVDQFSKTIATQQNLDGSWLTGPARPGGVFPNTESTILNIIALKLAWDL